MKQWIIDRSKERSTWIGFVALLTAAGMGVSPELSEAIASLGMAIGGFLAVVLKDKA